MLGGSSRDARRTERYLDGLMDAEERGAAEAPMDLDLDPAVLYAARELRAGLVRVHPSFRFEEGLAARLAQAARATQGTPSEQPAQVFGSSIAPFRSPHAAAPAGPAARSGRTTARDALATLAAPRRLSLTSRPSRPLVVGGVGVASAAISIGAVYVALAMVSCFSDANGSRRARRPIRSRIRARTRPPAPQSFTESSE